jgi:hypothetical protein
LFALIPFWYRELRLDWNADPRRWLVMVLIAAFMYFSLTWALTNPLRLMMQSRHWRKCGIDLIAIERETSVPGDIAEYFS